MERKKPELLMPAGSPELLRTVIEYGADAVYLGDETMSLRAKAKNFSIFEIRDAIAYAHERNVKVYVAANIFAHNDDLRKALKLFLQLKEAKPDGLIISDPGVFTIAKSICPDIPVHISTQANNTNYATFLFWHDQGVKRLVAARELTLREIAEIKSQLPEDMEIECFVHGAMCISYSGRCLISSFLTGRDANRGECTHPCRWSYQLVEEKRPGQYMPVFEDDRGTYLYHSRDLCMIGHLGDLIEAGADSLKVEGRMKNALYAATIARAYRRAIDDWFDSPEIYRDNIPAYEAEAAKCSNRGFTTGFYYGAPDASAQNYEGTAGNGEYVYLGTIFCEDGWYTFTQKNKFCVGDEIEVIRPDGSDHTVTVKALYNENKELVDSVPHASSKCYVDLGMELHDYDIMRTIQR